MSETKVRALTRAHRAGQVRRAASLAALVAAFWRARVDPSNPMQTASWIEEMTPRVLEASLAGAKESVRYATFLRDIEAPGTAPLLDYATEPGSLAEQIATSLRVVGPQAYRTAQARIGRLDVAPQQADALLREAKETSARSVAAATLRHVQSGSRATLLTAAREDPGVIGWVRVVRDTPCFFCAMLASRGPVFDEDSFADSNASFEGFGTVKVHDGCQCSIKPVRNRKTDPFIRDNLRFEDQWSSWGAGGAGKSSAYIRFRRGYEHWAKTGVTLDWETVDNFDLFVARNRQG